MKQSIYFYKELTSAEVGNTKTHEIYIRMPNNFDHDVFFGNMTVMNGPVLEVNFTAQDLTNGGNEAIPLRYVYFQNSNQEKRIPSLGTLFKSHNVQEGDIVCLGCKIENTTQSYFIRFYKKGEIQIHPSSIYFSKPDDENDSKSPLISFEHSLQQIFYGAPGTGKSHEIKEITKGQKVIRTTFHPDSDYSTFVGAYKPFMEKAEVRVVPVVVNNGISLDQNNGTYTEDKIVYKFVKQAFLKAYLAAWKKYHVFNSSLSNTVSSTSNTASIITNVSGQPTTPYTRTGNFGNNTSFGYTTEKGATLTPDEENRLKEVDNFDFPFDGIANFGELHNKKIKVVITDSPTVEQQTRYKKHITITAKLIKNLYNKWSNRNALSVEERITLEKIITLILNALEINWTQLDQLKNYQGPDLTIEIDDNAAVSLLGLYVSSEKTIFLFKNNIGDNEDLLCATYIHEMFHAYYDSINQYIPEIEEPIVENNTLCFLELFNKDYFDSYKDKVNKKKNCLAINYYGFGAYLYENRSLDWMQLYGNSFNKIQKNSSLVNQYNNMFANIYPFGKEQQTQNLLYAILSPQFGSLTSFNQNHETSSKHIYQFLIIEEINRGNCAQIFGDIFQLLDRQDNGFSTYPIEADADIQQAIKTAFEEEDEYKLNGSINVEGAVEDYTSNYGKTLSEDIQEGRILLLPPNLFIWATMNTSDQSLFPIDSAFKRRWDWQYVPISKGRNEDGSEMNWRIQVGSAKYDWWTFINLINDEIYSLTHSEDKKLGFFFCKANNGIISAETFVGKVLFYLWNDVFKDFVDDTGLFKDGDDILSYNKFYTVGVNGKTVVAIEKVALFLKNLKLDPITQDDEDIDITSQPTQFRLNGAAPQKLYEIARDVVLNYAKNNPKLPAQDIRDTFVNACAGIGISHIVETESEYHTRDGQISQARSACEITIPSGDKLYVSTQWRAKDSDDNFIKFMEIVNQNGWGTISK